MQLKGLSEVLLYAEKMKNKALMYNIWKMIIKSLLYQFAH